MPVRYGVPRGLTAHGEIQDDDWAAVHGYGGVGLSAVVLLRAGELGVEVLLSGGDEATTHILEEEIKGGAHICLDARRIHGHRAGVG